LVDFGEKVIKILNYAIPETGHYIVLETYSSIKSKARIIHVVSFKNGSNENSIFVGRGQDANVRITDISVSRKHTQLT